MEAAVKGQGGPLWFLAHPSSIEMNNGKTPVESHLSGDGDLRNMRGGGTGNTKPEVETHSRHLQCF